MEFDENKLQELAKKHLLRCRPGDWEHSLKVVEWVKILGKDIKSLNLIITAAYIHDIGWRDLLTGAKITKKELKKFEPIANNNSKTYAAEILTELAFTKKQIEFILNLIKAADLHKSNTIEEAIIVDADNLSKLNIEHLQRKYSSSDWKKMYKLWEIEMPTRIQTRIGKKAYGKLLDNLKNELTVK